MGCFNVTCGVSNLPICSGDPIVGYPLERDTRYENDDFIYRDYMISGWPIFGNYDDYGRIENDDGEFDIQGQEKDDPKLMVMHERFFHEIVCRSTSWRWDRQAKQIPQLKESWDAIGELPDKAPDDPEERKTFMRKFSDRHRLEEQWAEIYAFEYRYSKFFKTVIGDFTQAMRFTNVITNLHNAADVHGFRIAPSNYRGQEIDLDAIIKMQKLTFELTTDKMAYYAEME